MNTQTHWLRYSLLLVSVAAFAGAGCSSSSSSSGPSGIPSGERIEIDDGGAGDTQAAVTTGEAETRAGETVRTFGHIEEAVEEVFNRLGDPGDLLAGTAYADSGGRMSGFSSQPTWRRSDFEFIPPDDFGEGDNTDPIDETVACDNEGVGTVRIRVNETDSSFYGRLNFTQCELDNYHYEGAIYVYERLREGSATREHFTGWQDLSVVVSDTTTEGDQNTIAINGRADFEVDGRLFEAENLITIDEHVSADMEVLLDGEDYFAISGLELSSHEKQQHDPYAFIEAEESVSGRFLRDYGGTPGYMDVTTPVALRYESDDAWDNFCPDDGSIEMLGDQLLILNFGPQASGTNFADLSIAPEDGLAGIQANYADCAEFQTGMGF